MNTTPGKVYLVGAGPGDPLLLTLKAARAISVADVVVYDRLVHPRVLEHARRDVELVYVGKTATQHTLKQEEINALLVQLASQGKTVARVKGGDPFVFGRGGEEAETLVDAGIEFEVIPGITSAIAVPAYAGIPVTHRDHTSALGIITGHEDPTKTESALDFEHLAKGLDTLVFLMGVGNMGHITQKLIEHGKNPDTPAAVIQWGARPEQRTVVATLSTIVEKAAESGIDAPAVVVIGDVVNLREKLSWFDKRPLFGKRIVVTRAREQASELADRLEALGAGVYEFPVISCRPLEDCTDLDNCISNLEDYDWIIFTSVNGVKFFFERVFSLGADVRALAGISIGAMGEATRASIEERSLKVDFTPTRYVGETFAEEFPDRRPGVKVLLPRAAEAREIIPDELRSAGCDVETVDCYRTVTSDSEAAELRLLIAAGSVDAVTFSSSSTVRNFVHLLALDQDFTLPDSLKIISIGPITSKTINDLGLRLDAEASEHTIPGLVQAVLSVFSK